MHKNCILERTKHSITSLDFFDVVYRSDIVRPDGQIKKCLDEYVGLYCINNPDPPGFLVADELRKALALDGSSIYKIFSESDRQEFLFHVFKAICLGGKLCQYEDTLEPYIKTAKVSFE